MEFIFNQRDIVGVGTFKDSVKSFYKRPTKLYVMDNEGSEDLTQEEAKDKLKEGVKEENKEGRRSFSNLKKERKSESVDYNDITEDAIDKELESVSDEDMKEFAGLAISILDWVLEKILNNFFNREKINDRPSDVKMKERLKIVGAKVITKWGVKFKIEFLFLMMFAGYVAGRYTSAKKIVPDEKDNGKIVDIKEASKKTESKRKGFRNRADKPVVKMETKLEEGEVKEETKTKRTFG